MIDYIYRINSAHRAMIVCAVEDAYDEVRDGAQAAYVDLEGSNFPSFMARAAIIEFNAIVLTKAEELIGIENDLSFGFDVHEGKYKFVKE